MAMRTVTIPSIMNNLDRRIEKKVGKCNKSYAPLPTRGVTNTVHVLRYDTLYEIGHISHVFFNLFLRYTHSKQTAESARGQTRRVKNGEPLGKLIRFVPAAE